MKRNCIDEFTLLYLVVIKQPQLPIVLNRRSVVPTIAWLPNVVHGGM